jgi:hypothetical protein
MVRISRRSIIKGSALALGTAVTGIPDVFARADYKYQASIKGLQIPNEATIIGVGRFGSWVAMCCAIAGVSRLSIFDPGQIDEADLACTPFPARTAGQSKAKTMQSVLLTLRPDASVEIHELAFELPKHSDALRGTIFNGASDAALHAQLPSEARKKGLKYVSGVYRGLSAGTLTGTHKNLKIAPRGSDIPVWVGSAALSATLAVNSAFTNGFEFVGGPAELAVKSSKQLESRLALLGDANP